MSVFPPVFGPKAVWRDLKNFLVNQDREKVIGLTLALLVTGIVLILFFVDSKVNTEGAPTVIYTESWNENRTAEEIIADQLRDQAEGERRAAERQQTYRDLANAVGMDDVN